VEERLPSVDLDSADMAGARRGMEGASHKPLITDAKLGEKRTRRVAVSEALW
jgi:hypothetical protein